jgi:tetratricopeptide (TPR) repeat protein
MLRKITTPRYEAYLAGFRMGAPLFEDPKILPASMRPVWTALRADAVPAAVRNAELALGENRLFSAEEKAGLLMGLSAALLRSGAVDACWDAARKSLDLFPYQVAAHRLQTMVLSRKRDYAAAYENLETIANQEKPAAWDSPMETIERQMSLASFSWLMGQWDQVAEHITMAYPSGLGSMPDEIREDWFRLALYRDEPDAAAAAAVLLIASRTIDQTDEMLQTFVQSGWTSQALPLYRDAFGREPESELLRRRLVALCIKEGDLEEARRLTAPGALRTAA